MLPRPQPKKKVVAGTYRDRPESRLVEAYCADYKTFWWVQKHMKPFGEVLLDEGNKMVQCEVVPLYTTQEVIKYIESYNDMQEAPQVGLWARIKRLWQKEQAAE